MASSEHSMVHGNAVVDRLAVWIATGLGVGLVTPAPGTVGGAWGLLLIPPLFALSSLQWQVAAIVLLAALAMVVSDRAATALEGGGADDPQPIVLDEIVALPIVFLGLTSFSWLLAAIGFLLFRVFDITKPWPARAAEKLHGGVGIVADDLFAALWARLALEAVLRIDAAAGFHWLSGAASA